MRVLRATDSKRADYNDSGAGAPAFAFLSLYNAPVSDEARNRNVILLATAILVAPRLRELRDSPALRSAVADAVRVAKYIARVVDATLRRDDLLKERH